MSKKNKPHINKTSIGGQAVLEGVMMRSENGMATAVRDSNGIIRVETKKMQSPKKRPLIFRLPIFRGIYSFVQSFFGGTSVLMRSVEVFGEGEPSKFEKWVAKTFKIDVMSVVGFFSLILGLVFAVGLFIFLPQLLRVQLQKWFNGGLEFNVWAKNFIEGGIKLLIFIIYILLVSILKDIRRTFMYHGAEHKTISCYEKGLELTVENAKKCSRVHNRCGTTFIVFVLVISIIVFAVFEALVGVKILDVVPNKTLYNVIRIGCKIALLPIVAGLSYELLKALAKTDCWVFYPIKLPGLLLQRLTTREPDESMLEVAITAFKLAKEFDDNPNAKEKTFVCQEKLSKLLDDTSKILKENGIDEQAEAQWIVSICFNIKRDKLNIDKTVSALSVDKVNKIVEQRITGKPLWYCFGDTDFYGYKIKVDERVLIPRPETELLVENAIKYIKQDSYVLDLCTGSGAIAIAIKKQINSKVVAVDISSGAISVASENAKINNAEIEFIESDLFANLHDRKFDVIISNPPYIKSEEIMSLQNEVKNFEPHLALDGGIDGLEFYKKIACQSANFLNKNGVILFEVGETQAEDVKNLLLENNFTNIEVIKDYENIERIIKAELNV